VKSLSIAAPPRNALLADVLRAGERSYFTPEGEKPFTDFYSHV
jgi:hypothetical protein